MLFSGNKYSQTKVKCFLDSRSMFLKLWAGHKDMCNTAATNMLLHATFVFYTEENNDFWHHFHFQNWIGNIRVWPSPAPRVAFFNFYTDCEAQQKSNGPA